jgi:hypothetical protein
MKKIHLKYSLLILCFMVVALFSAMVRTETKQAVKQSASKYFDHGAESDKEYRYCLQIFKLFNAR